MARIEPSQLADIFDAHASRLVLYARQWVDLGVAEDIVQDVFVRLAGQCDLPANVRAWLFTCVRHAALDAMKCARRRRDRDASAGQLHAARDVAALFEHRAQDRVDAIEAQESLAQLPEREREIITLRIWGGATFQEIADITRLPLSTIHNSYRSGLAMIRARMESSCRKT